MMMQDTVHKSNQRKERSRREEFTRPPRSTLLFVPGDRPERFDKASTSDADLVVLDLEDAAGVAQKSAARSKIVAYLKSGYRAVVRIKAVDTPHFGDDVAALTELTCAIMLAKDAGSITTVTESLPTHPVIALVETARGVLDADQIAASPGASRHENVSGRPGDSSLDVSWFVTECQ
jgi:citrate lyase subunit beta / citryl-CoA lyase